MPVLLETIVKMSTYASLGYLVQLDAVYSAEKKNKNKNAVYVPFFILVCLFFCSVVWLGEILLGEVSCHYSIAANLALL